LQPRPDRIEPVVVFVGVPGDSAFQSIGSASSTVNLTNMNAFPEQTAVLGIGTVGKTTILIT